MSYIKLDRNILGWEWFTDINTCHLFIYMLLRANWETGSFKGYDIPRGSFVSSIDRLAADTGLSIANVRTAIRHLTKTGEIEVESTNKFSVYTIRNYALYQDSLKAELTVNEHSTDNQSTTIEKEKKEKEHLSRARENDRELYKNFQTICNLYPKNDGKAGAFKSYKLWLNGLIVGGTKYKLTNRAIWTAVDKYVKQQEERGVEIRYYMDFKTLMFISLLDYIDDKEQYAEVDDT